MKNIVIFICIVNCITCLGKPDKIIDNPFLITDELISKYDQDNYNNLIELKAKVQYIQNIQERIYTVPKNLKVLELGDHKFTFHSLNRFDQLTEIEILYLVMISPSDYEIIVNTIKEFKKLKKLFIIQGSYKDLDFVKYFKKLEILVIYGISKFNDMKLDFKNNSNLKYFAFINQSIYLKSRNPRFYIERRGVKIENIPSKLKLANFIGSEAIKLDLKFINQFSKSTEIFINQDLLDNINLDYVMDNEKSDMTFKPFKTFENVRLLNNEETKYFKPYKRQGYNIFKDKKYYLQIYSSYK